MNIILGRKTTKVSKDVVEPPRGYSIPTEASGEHWRANLSGIQAHTLSTMHFRQAYTVESILEPVGGVRLMDRNALTQRECLFIHSTNPPPKSTPLSTATG